MVLRQWRIHRVSSFSGLAACVSGQRARHPAQHLHCLFRIVGSAYHHGSVALSCPTVISAMGRLRPLA